MKEPISWELIVGMICGFGAVATVAFLVVSCEISNQRMANEYGTECIRAGGSYIRDNSNSAGSPSGGHCINPNVKK